MIAPNQSIDKPIPAQAGIGLRSEHYQVLSHRLPSVAWLECHSENYFGDGGEPIYYLSALARHYPLSFHGIGLSLGSADPLSLDHLKKLKTLIDHYQPGLVSEHLSWSSLNGRYYNDLLPLPYTQQSLNHMVDRIDQAQNFLGRQLLIENVSSYLQFTGSDIPEWEFVAATAKRAGCGILLDINNIYVNANNHGLDPYTYINHIPAELVGEFHLAGHTVKQVDGTHVMIDSHDHPVCAAVWQLYRYALEHIGVRPTLIEWDTNLPPLDTLLAEAATARHIIEAQHEHVA